MSQKIRKTLLIVCEGTNSEPNYFYDLQKEVQKKGLDYKILIQPKPPQLTKEEKEEKEKEDNANGVVATKRKARQLKKVANEPVLKAVPDEYKSQPARYVWHALDGLEIHDEAWSVFDKDGHANPELAFLLAETLVNGRKVNIAFSSISFEIWRLLHYEYNTTPFGRTQCRTGKESHECGENSNNPNDCKGGLCITGYLKTNRYIDPKSNVKHFRYAPVADITLAAIERAVRLRKEKPKGAKPLYEVIPYTDIDKLVFKLLHLEHDYKWIDLADALKLSISFQVTRKGNLLNIAVQNTSDTTCILLPEEYRFVNVKGEIVRIFGRKKPLQPQERLIEDVDLSLLQDFSPLYICIPLDNNNGNGIFEIPL